MTKLERELLKDGYVFSGHYYGYSEKPKALDKAKEFRAQGHKARVVTQLSKGRVYNSEGYSVFIKKQ